MKPSCVCTTALWAGMKRCQLHSRKAVQKHGNPLTGLRASAQASSMEESSETWQQAKCIDVLVLALGGVLVIVGVGVGGSPNAFAPGVKAAGGTGTQPTPSPCCRLWLLLIILLRYLRGSDAC